MSKASPQLFVSGFDPTISAQALKEQFEKYGCVDDIVFKYVSIFLENKNLKNCLQGGIFLYIFFQVFRFTSVHLFFHLRPAKEKERKREVGKVTS